MSEGRVKKPYYRPHHNHSRQKHYLEAGQRGFFCTCNFREKDCVKEAYNLLNEYGDKLYGSSKEPSMPKAEAAQEEVIGEEESADISEQLQKEIDDIKKSSKKDVKDMRYQAVDTGASNCVFIRTNLPNPEQITTAIFKDLVESKMQKTRYLLRILPIMATCKANMQDITQVASNLFDEHFVNEPSTFSVVFNKRYHSKLSRDDIIKELADIVAQKNASNKADLKHPQKAIIVEIIKGICLLSVVENFYEFRKYNMFEICQKKEEKTDAKDAADENNGVTEAGQGDAENIAEGAKETESTEKVTEGEMIDVRGGRGDSK